MGLPSPELQDQVVARCLVFLATLGSVPEALGEAALGVDGRDVRALRLEQQSDLVAEDTRAASREQLARHAVHGDVEVGEVRQRGVDDHGPLKCGQRLILAHDAAAEPHDQTEPRKDTPSHGSGDRWWTEGERHGVGSKVGGDGRTIPPARAMRSCNGPSGASR